jgi:Tol biopolymer transport system component
MLFVVTSSRGETMKHYTAIAVLAIVTAAITLGVAAASATAPGKNGRIVYRIFLNEDQTHAPIVTMRADGTHRKWVTHPSHGVAHLVPDWSADGRWIAFIRANGDWQESPKQSHHPRIFRIHPDGTGKKNLSFTCTGICHHDDDPAWSPNGKWIAFSRVFERKGDNEVDIMVMRADGTHVRNVTRHPSGQIEDWSVQWAPNGRRLVFSRFNEPREAVFTVRLDGTGLRRVSPWRNDFGPKFPDWSPNGRWILYRDNGIWLTHPNREGRHRITPEGDWISSSFSPNGMKIVTSRVPAGRKADVFVMNLDGSGLVNITHSPRWDSAPDWGSRRT